jgi:hypothetical protein
MAPEEHTKGRDGHAVTAPAMGLQMAVRPVLERVRRVERRRVHDLNKP